MYANFAVAIICWLLLQPSIAARPSQEDAQRKVVRAAAPEWDPELYAAIVQGDYRVVVRVNPAGDVDSATCVGWTWNRYAPLHARVAKRWKFAEQEEWSEHVVVFDYQYLPLESKEEDWGAAFIRPYRIEMRKRRPTSN